MKGDRKPTRGCIQAISFVGLFFFTTFLYAAEEFEVNALTAKTENGRVLGEVSEKTQALLFFKVLKQVVYQILQQMNVKEADLPVVVKAALDKPQTTNLEAVVAFSNGLDAMDNRKFEEAYAYFKQATALDPHFELAVSMRETTENMGAMNIANSMRASPQVVQAAQSRAMASRAGGSNARGGGIVTNQAALSGLSNMLQGVAVNQSVADTNSTQAQSEKQTLQPQNEIAFPGAAKP